MTLRFQLSLAFMTDERTANSLWILQNETHGYWVYKNGKKPGLCEYKPLIVPKDHASCNEAANAENGRAAIDLNDCVFVPPYVGAGPLDKSHCNSAPLAAEAGSSRKIKMQAVLAAAGHSQTNGFVANGKILNPAGELVERTASDEGIPLCQFRRGVSSYRCYKSNKQCAPAFTLETKDGLGWYACGTACNRNPRCLAYSAKAQGAAGECRLCTRTQDDEGMITEARDGYAFCDSV